MIDSNLTAILALVGVFIGAVLGFISQSILYRQQEKSELRKNAINLKNEECLKLWKAFSEVYQYIYFSGSYSQNKIDAKGLGEHIKRINMAIIQVEPFISQQNFEQLLLVRDSINGLFIKIEGGNGLPYKEIILEILEIEKPMNSARDVLREELGLTSLVLHLD